MCATMREISRDTLQDGAEWSQKRASGAKALRNPDSHIFQISLLTECTHFWLLYILLLHIVRWRKRLTADEEALSDLCGARLCPWGYHYRPYRNTHASVPSCLPQGHFIRLFTDYTHTHTYNIINYPKEANTWVWDTLEKVSSLAHFPQDVRGVVALGKWQDPGQ